MTEHLMPRHHHDWASPFTHQSPHTLSLIKYTFTIWVEGFSSKLNPSCEGLSHTLLPPFVLALWFCMSVEKRNSAWPNLPTHNFSLLKIMISTLKLHTFHFFIYLAYFLSGQISIGYINQPIFKWTLCRFLGRYFLTQIHPQITRGISNERFCNY